MSRIWDWLKSGKVIGLLLLIVFALSAFGENWGIKVNLTATNLSVCILGLALMFQSRLRPLLDQISKIKIGDNEIELKRDVEAMSKEVKAAEVVAAKSPDVAPKVESFIATKSAVPVDPTGPLFDLAATNPGLAVIEVGRRIEETLRTIMMTTGWTTPKPPPFRVLVEAAVQKGVFPAETASAIQNFWSVRNRVAHVARAESEELLAGVFSAGMQIWGLLERLRSKYEEHEVVGSGVDLFKDPACKVKIDNAKGVILRSTSADKSVLRVFPTRREYHPGEIVSWHFDMASPQGEAWVQTPLIYEGRVTRAWMSAGHFAGEVIRKA